MIVIELEQVTILTWTLDHHLNLGREMRWRQKKFEGDIMFTHHLVFSDFSHFGAIRRPHSRCIVHSSLTTTFYLIKAENRIKKSLIKPSFHNFDKKYYFLLKMLDFSQKNGEFSKFRDSWYFKVYLLKVHMSKNI